MPNVSKDIRWSLDLRWQRPTEPFGFYNLKDGVLMRSSKDPNLEIDWEKFNKVDRHQEQRKAMDVSKLSETRITSFFLENFFDTVFCVLTMYLSIVLYLKLFMGSIVYGNAKSLLIRKVRVTSKNF